MLRHMHNYQPKRDDLVNSTIMNNERVGKLPPLNIFLTIFVKKNTYRYKVYWHPSTHAGANLRWYPTAKSRMNRTAEINQTTEKWRGSGFSPESPKRHRYKVSIYKYWTSIQVFKYSSIERFMINFLHYLQWVVKDL